MQKILIDTDPGQDIDDLLAIWFALLRPELDVLAITTVTWPTEKRARLIKRLLRHLNRMDIPVAAGMQFPLCGMSEDESRNQYDLARSLNHYCFAEPEDRRDDPGATDAIELMIQTIERHPGEVALVCLAPLTNIAVMLSRRPDLAPRIGYIALMGGETTLNRREHNIAFDYAAADIVFRAAVPIFMGTWDITRRFVLSQADCDSIHRRGTPLTGAIARAIEAWHPAQSWKPGPVMYDLFPILWSFERTLYQVRPMHISIETTGTFTRGMTLPTAGPPNAQVTVGIREAEIRELYLSTILQ